MTNSTARKKLIQAQACMQSFDAHYAYCYEPGQKDPARMEQAYEMLEVIRSTVLDALMELMDIKTGSNLIPLFEKASPKDRATVLRILRERIERLAA